jgi:hypothetical protein
VPVEVHDPLPTDLAGVLAGLVPDDPGPPNTADSPDSPGAPAVSTTTA